MSLLFAILVDGTVYAAWLFLVAAGLTIIFGVLKILNIAHGSFYALGAYVAATSLGWWFAGKPPSYEAFAILFLAAIATGVIVGTLMERTVLVRLQGYDEVSVALATYALLLIFEDFMQIVWGTRTYPANQPYMLLGRTTVGGLVFNNYEFAVVGLAAVVGIALWWTLNKTRWGHTLVAVIHDRDMAAAMGINVRRVFTTTFVLGAVLGALGGAFTAPMIQVAPGIGVEIIVITFAVAVIGGLGSIEGAIVGSLAVGLARATAIHLWPQIEVFIIYAVMAFVLLVRPHGLFARPAPRQI
jgi:branched-chain amino acid transport system permease protein